MNRFTTTARFKSHMNQHFLNRMVVGSNCAALLLAISCISIPSRSQSKDQYGFSTANHQVCDIFFIDSVHGWAILHDNGHRQWHLFKTQDGGQVWTDVRSPDGLFHVYFLNWMLGWALQSSTISAHDHGHISLLRTENGGATWKKVSEVPLTAIAANPSGGAEFAFADRSHGWFVGSSFTDPVLETSDGGITFQSVEGLPKRHGNPYGLCTGKGAGVWIYGDGFVLNSKDGGKTWVNPIDLRQLRANPEAFNINDGYFSPSGKGYLVGQDSDGVILSSSDFGRHWSKSLESESAGNFWAISFWTGENGCAVGYPNYLYCTSDGGATWNSRNTLPLATSGQASSFRRLVMLKSERGWALRDGGYLYETLDGGQTWRELDFLASTGNQ